ncbi:hypothetical protein [Blastococcus sp. KM273128]|uniref:hypothetical protein n=1 Tax=Blastococcus sp. KM273128 TaxID=2570314 RepID=UPI001F48BF7A|nr:hypothetical protein [Blastococcus sp. KM273128]
MLASLRRLSPASGLLAARAVPSSIADSTSTQTANATQVPTAPTTPTRGRPSAWARYVAATAYMPSGKTMLHSDGS